jgi:hypothetical protein
MWWAALWRFAREVKSGPNTVVEAPLWLAVL